MFKRLMATIDAGAGSLMDFRPFLRASRVAAPPPPDYRAVSVLLRGPACGAAQACAGQRMLLRPNTRLPLRDCTTPDQCRCRFAMHADRRQGERRSLSVTWKRAIRLGLDRRAGRGRRASDRDATAAPRAGSRPVPS